MHRKGDGPYALAMTTPAYPPKPLPGDRIAVISPAAGLPGLFPRPYELGLERLRKEFGLEPVEYPATRKMGSTPRERADDIHAAFADPTSRRSSRRSAATTRSPCCRCWTAS